MTKKTTTSPAGKAAAILTTVTATLEMIRYWVSARSFTARPRNCRPLLR